MRWLSLLASEALTKRKRAIPLSITGDSCDVVNTHPDACRPGSARNRERVAAIQRTDPAQVDESEFSRNFVSVDVATVDPDRPFVGIRHSSGPGRRPRCQTRRGYWRAVCSDEHQSYEPR